MLNDTLATALSAILNKENLSTSQSKISAKELAGLIARISDNTISGKIAKQVFEAMWLGEGDADKIIKKKGLKQITDNSVVDLLYTIQTNLWFCLFSLKPFG